MSEYRARQGEPANITRPLVGFLTLSHITFLYYVAKKVWVK